MIAFLRLQISSAIFGIGILALISITAAFWQPDWAIYRYDALFVLVIAIQAALIAFGLETWREARVIAVFHIVGVIMEIFKTSVGAWVYPEAAILRIGGVPLFTGFMYSAVGSYIARFWRLSGMRVEHLPDWRLSAVLALLIYVNFYSHHFLPDIRMVLFAAAIVLYWRSRAVFGERAVPLLLLFLAVGILVYIAENIGSLSGTWLYPNQHGGWRPVHIGKLGSWTLLMIVSFELVRSVHRPMRY